MADETPIPIVSVPPKSDPPPQVITREPTNAELMLQIVYARRDVVDVAADVVGLREDFVSLKGHVNDQHEAYTVLLKGKADRSDLTLFVLWKQSPMWLKIVGGIATVAAGIAAALAGIAGGIPI